MHECLQASLLLMLHVWRCDDADACLATQHADQGKHTVGRQTWLLWHTVVLWWLLLKTGPVQ